jgi:hypothetical protein
LIDYVKTIPTISAQKIEWKTHKNNKTITNQLGLVQQIMIIDLSNELQFESKVNEFQECCGGTYLYTIVV